jgi:hypothetical protein
VGPHPSGHPPTPLDPLACWPTRSPPGARGTSSTTASTARTPTPSTARRSSCRRSPTSPAAPSSRPPRSIPERLGGNANWDYRYAWLRDASLIAQSLLQATCADEAERYFAWIARSALTPRDAPHVQIVYGVGGERILEEAALDQLRGFADSRPVRIGNAAWRQQQLDVLGEVLNVAAALDDGPGLDLAPTPAGSSATSSIGR